MSDWLNELMDEYAAQVESRTKKSGNEDFVTRIGLAFSNEPAEIMEAAVLAYIRENHFFPKTAELNPYVTAAQENARGEKPYHQIEQQSRRRYTDDEMLRWEQRRGTMPENDRLGYLWEPANPEQMVIYMLLNWRRAIRPLLEASRTAV